MTAQQNHRAISFQRNESLENLLNELNSNLEPANQQLLQGIDVSPENRFPIIFIFGAPRSGSTLLMQWLASTGLCAYPSNLLSRFYRVPLIGAKIQLLLTDPRYAFNDELFDLDVSTEFKSANGKTSGALSPHEFWYFWRRFGFNENYSFTPDEDLQASITQSAFSAELQGLAQIFRKPFALKAMIASQNIDLIKDVVERSICIWTRRQPEYNIQSLLEARRRQYGTIDTWYSYRINEFEQLDALEADRSVAGQVYYINKAIEKSFASLPDNRKLVVDYEKFCENPAQTYHSLCTLIEQHGTNCCHEYPGPTEFHAANQWHIPEYGRAEVLAAYESFLDDKGLDK